MDIMERRRMMMGGPGWAKEPFIIFEGAWNTGESWSRYIDDVTRYRTLKMTYRNIYYASDEELYKDFGIVTDENFGKNADELKSESGDYSVYERLSAADSGTKTVSLDIEKLKGKKQLSMRSRFVFSGGETTGIKVSKIWMEG